MIWVTCTYAVLTTCFRHVGDEIDNLGMSRVGRHRKCKADLGEGGQRAYIMAEQHPREVLPENLHSFDCLRSKEWSKPTSLNEFVKG